MLVNDLIQMLCDDTERLIEILIEKRESLVNERAKLELSIVNLNKVVRIAMDVRSRKLRSEKEISELHDALDYVAKQGTDSDGELDLTNLYRLGNDIIEPDENGY